MKVLKGLSLFFLTFLFISSFINAAEAIDESLLLYFPFDESKGEKVNDQSENGFVGNCYGGFEWVAGKFGNAISLNGTDGYVEVEHDERLNLKGSFTIEAWFKNGGMGGWKHLIDKGYGNDDLVYMITLSPDLVINLAIANWPNHIQGIALEADRWYHVAGVQNEDENSRKLYVDGEIVAEGKIVGEVENDAPVKMGARHSGQFSDFTIDNLAIYTKALTKSEIEQHIGSGITLSVNSHDKLTITWGKLKTLR